MMFRKENAWSKSKFEPEENLLEAVKVRSKIDGFFEKKSENLKFCKFFLAFLVNLPKTHKSLFNDFFVGTTICSAGQQIDFDLFWGSQNFEYWFLLLGGLRVIEIWVINKGWIVLQNEPLPVRILRNPCIASGILAETVPVK